MKIAITDYSFPSLDIEEGILRPVGHGIAARKEGKSASELTTLVAAAGGSAKDTGRHAGQIGL